MERAIFLDRDGVILIDQNLKDIGLPGKEITSIEDVKLYPEVPSFVKDARDRGYVVVVVTNQSKVGRGVLKMEVLNEINNYVNELCGNQIQKFYNCIHTKDAGCKCRKPGIGLVNQATKDFNIDPYSSWFVGDKTVDIETGRRANLKTILVKTGYAGRDKMYDVKPDYVADNLAEAGKIIFSP